MAGVNKVELLEEDLSQINLLRLDECIENPIERRLFKPENILTSVSYNFVRFEYNL